MLGFEPREPVDQHGEFGVLDFDPRSLALRLDPADDKADGGRALRDDGSIRQRRARCGHQRKVIAGSGDASRDGLVFRDVRQCRPAHRRQGLDHAGIADICGEDSAADGDQDPLAFLAAFIPGKQARCRSATGGKAHRRRAPPGHPVLQEGQSGEGRNAGEPPPHCHEPARPSASVTTIRALAAPPSAVATPLEARSPAFFRVASIRCRAARFVAATSSPNSPSAAS